MNIFYFLGANSGEGFASLYSSFPPEKDTMLHIIKAGPGTGKSTFMRKIGKKAEEAGLDVEYVLCSGDPQSLDGVYVPQWKTAWVDGTAPHVGEPVLFGVNSDYVNLGIFLRQPFSPAEAEKLEKLQRSYKQQYREAYEILAAAEHLQQGCIPDFFGENGRAAICRRMHGILNRNLRNPASGLGRERRFFLRAISCQGDYRLNRQIQELCKQIIQVDSGLSGLDPALQYTAREARKRGVDVIACPSPLRPQELEALLIPSEGLAFVGSDWDFEGARGVHIDNLADVKLLQARRNLLREGKKLEKKTMELAFAKLHQAKALHDEMEELYQSHMDFPALSRFTDRYLQELAGATAAGPRLPAAAPETEGLPR